MNKFGFLVAAVLLLCGCVLAPKYVRPELTVLGIELEGGNLFQQHFLVRLRVRNPNARALPVTDVHAQLRLTGDQVASGVSNRAFVVPAFGTADFDMSISVNLAAALLKFANQRDRHVDGIDYEVTGEAEVDLPFLHSLPFHQRGTYSLRDVP